MMSLEGTWKDTLGNRYTVSVDEPPRGLTVQTERPHGRVQTTKGLIRVEGFPDGTSAICWGRGFALGERFVGDDVPQSVGGGEVQRQVANIIWTPRSGSGQKFFWSREEKGTDAESGEAAESGTDAESREPETTKAQPEWIAEEFSGESSSESETKSKTTLMRTCRIPFLKRKITYRSWPMTTKFGGSTQKRKHDTEEATAETARITKKKTEETSAKRENPSITNEALFSFGEGKVLWAEGTLESQGNATNRLAKAERSWPYKQIGIILNDNKKRQCVDDAKGGR